MQLLIMGTFFGGAIAAAPHHGFLRNYVPPPVPTYMQPVYYSRYTAPCVSLCQTWTPERVWPLENSCEIVCKTFFYWTLDDDHKQPQKDDDDDSATTAIPSDDIIDDDGSTTHTTTAIPSDDNLDNGSTTHTTTYSPEKPFRINRL